MGTTKDKFAKTIETGDAVAFSVCRIVTKDCNFHTEIGRERSLFFTNNQLKVSTAVNRPRNGRPKKTIALLFPFFSS